MINHRLDLFRRQLSQSSQFQASIISKKENLLYLVDFVPQHPTEREAFLLLTDSAKPILYHSPFLEVAASTKQLADLVPITPTTSFSQLLSRTYGPHFSSHLGVEKTNLTLSEAELISQTLPSAKLSPIDLTLAKLRQTKDSTEVDLLLQAGRIAAQTLNWCQTWLKHASRIGITENQLAQAINHKLIQLGADGPAFPTIVAFDAHTANPHHIPGEAPLTPNSIILIDMGADYHHYKSDLTRTWQLGHTPNPQFLQIKQAVDSAYHQAESLFTSSPTQITADQIDATARHSLTTANLGTYFIHSTGHGLGLEAHELPHINTTDASPIVPGTAFTIEPGAYLPGQFGYRHENSFILTSSGLVCTTT